MQLVGGVLDLATSKLISTSSKRLLEGPIPDDFNPDALAILRRFAGDIDEIKEIFRVKLIGDVGENSTIWQRINRAGEPGQFTIAQRDEFIMDFDIANKQTLVALNDNDGFLIDYWLDIKELKGERININFLNAYRRFKDLKNNEFKHIWELHGTTGGHRYIYVTNDFSGNELYKIVSNDIDNTIDINDRTKIYSINGHTYYENLWRYNTNLNVNNPKVFKIGGVGVSRKPKHFVINPSWTEQKLLEEMSYAYKNKLVKKSGRLVKIKHGGIRIEVVETKYKTRFSDGTKIEIIHRSQDVDPISGDLLPDHISLFSILKP